MSVGYEGYTEAIDNNDCAVRAVAAACDIPYQKSYDVLKFLGRKKGGRTENTHIKIAINLFGFSLIPLDRGECKTVLSASRRLPKTSDFIVFTRGHVLCISKGKVMDWTEGRKHHVKQLFMVVPTESLK